MDFYSHASSSRGNCYVLQSGASRLLLEAGLPALEIKRRLGFTLSGVAGCLVTHEHKDHSKGAPQLLRLGVDVWTSKGTAEAMGLATKRLESGKQVQIGPFAVMPFAAQHDAEEPLGFLISDGADKLLFATDTAYLAWRFVGLTLIAIECNFARDLLGDMPQSQRARLEGSHMGLEQCKELLQANDPSRVREIHLLHLSRDHSDAVRFKRELESLTGLPVQVEEE